MLCFGGARGSGVHRPRQQQNTTIDSPFGGKTKGKNHLLSKEVVRGLTAATLQNAGQWVTSVEHTRAAHVLRHHNRAFVSGERHDFLIAASLLRGRGDGAGA